MNIYEWVQLKRSSTCLSSWPRPPTPQIDYHLIKFGMSNGRYEAYFGLAKTLDDVLQALTIKFSLGFVHVKMRWFG